MSFLLFATIILLVLSGFPVAFTLAGVSLLFAFIGIAVGDFDPNLLHAMNSRLYGIMTNSTLIALPLFILMGITMQRGRIADNLLLAFAKLFVRLRGGLGIGVILLGALISASTGIVGTTVVTMGLLSLPIMLRHGYHPSVASGVICASGTLGQIIPPSIALILLGDVISSAYLKSQLDQGDFMPQSVSVADLFVGALFPGMLLVFIYLAYILLVAFFKPDSMPQVVAEESSPKVGLAYLMKMMFVPLGMIAAVLGSIVAGIATPTEAASIGAMGALLITMLQRQLSWKKLKEICQVSTRMTCMVFMILIGASFFSLVFRGFGGDDIVHEALSGVYGGVAGTMFVVLLAMFLLGFVIDFIEITLMVVPIVAPVLLTMGVDPIWLGVMFAMTLQTSFLTPPFGFSLFYLRGVAPPSVRTQDIYRGAAPFVMLQLGALVLLSLWPQIVTWLPGKVF